MPPYYKIIYTESDTCVRNGVLRWVFCVSLKEIFIHMDESSFILLYKSMVRPHLEYANSVWCPYKQGDIKQLEKIQKELLNW